MMEVPKPIMMIWLALKKILHLTYILFLSDIA